MKVIAKGAEATLIKENKDLIKKRIEKEYRHKSIDQKLRKRRTKSEGKILSKLQGIINVPKISEVKEFSLKMQYLNGKTLADSLEKLEAKKQKQVIQEIGKTVALIHNQGIIHGDLTTSNMILKDKLYFIDFGLSFHSVKIEDKAVDLHLLKEGFESKHFKISNKAIKIIEKEYQKHSKDKDKVILRLKDVEARGRYKRKVKS